MLNRQCIIGLVSGSVFISASQHLHAVMLNLFQHPNICTSMSFYIYILTNKNNTTFYVGVTNNLDRRTLEHKNKVNNGFSYKYNLEKLVYFEECGNSMDAIRREKQLKNWHRDWKINLIKSVNPEFKDLYIEYGDPETSSG